MWYVQQRLYSTCVWSISTPLTNVFHGSAGSDVFHHLLHWKFSVYTCDTIVRFAFISATTRILRIAIPVGFIIALHIARGKHLSAYVVGIVRAISIHSDGIRRLGFYLNGLRVFGSTLVSGAFAMPADSVIFVGCLSTKRCCQG